MESVTPMNELKIGWASRDVSTTKPVNIPGQFSIRVSRGIIDPVTVTALVIDNGADIAIFLSGDFVSIQSYLVTEVRDAVAKRIPGFPVEKILMGCTHTHAGPSYYKNDASAEVPHDDIEIADSNEYRAFLVAQIAEAIAEAYAGRAPGGIAYGYGYAVAGHSRRVVFFDDRSKRPGAGGQTGVIVEGHAAQSGNTNDPMFSHYEAGADHFVNLLYTFDPAGKLTGAVVNVPCPSQNSEAERRLTASFWNEVREDVRAKHGNIFLLPQCAAAGDLHPRLLHYKQAEARRFRLKFGDENPKEVQEYLQRKDIATRITAAFDEVLAWARKDIQTALPLTHVVKTIELHRRFITDEEYANELKQYEELAKLGFKQDGTPDEKLSSDSRLWTRRRRSERILERYRIQAAQPRLPMELHAIRLGDLAFVSNCFELFMDYQHRIQARSPFVQTFVVQLCGTPHEGTGGYLATERGAWGKGYSACQYCNQVSPQGGQELVEETLRALQAIHEAPTV
ncbi:MAG: hypothetical protein GX592_13410 [Clostridiales bacterium]|nr:hypothetical protein [Clostridiales bacterium]